MRSNKILAEIEYNPYAVLIANIDGERFFQSRSGLAAFSQASDIFTRECSDYYRRLWKNLKSFAGPAPEKLSKEKMNKFDDFLFNPACFIGFGSIDNIAFVAMDDFDLSTQLISKVDLPIRQTCLAFSPKVKSLGLNEDIFCEIKDICNTPLDRDPDGDDEDAWGEAWKKKIQKLKAPRHEFLKERPLVAVTYYKFNSMAVLGPGLLMQQAAYRAISKGIENAIKELKNSKDEKIADAAVSFKCALLDPQGWADMASIMLCKDYSVIAAILARIRSITHRDMYEHHSSPGSETPEEYIQCFELHERVAKAFKKCAKDIWKQDWKPDELFRDNHVFCSAYSAFGISHEAFEAQKPERYVSGHVIADTKFVCGAGHCEKVKDIVSKHRYRADYDPQVPHMWYLVGHDDFIYQQMLDKEYDSACVVRLADFIRQIKSMRDCYNSEIPDNESYLSLHVLEMSSELRIPLPAQRGLSGFRSGHVGIRLVLDRCRNWLFDEDNDEGLSLNKLHDALRTLQLPSPLSSALRFLFLDYSNCLADDFLFDNVLDLHDVFTSVYDLIVRRLTKQMKKKVDSTYEARTFLQGADLDNIVELVELLRNALSNRAQIAFREAERWGITLDIRGGGFNRLLNAADVPLKCGLGLLWRVLKGESRLAPEIDENEAAKLRIGIGGASKITYDSRSYSHRLGIGDNPKYFITSVDLNLIHLTRPRNLLIHFHETAHLICHFLRDEVGCTHLGYPCSKARIECHRCKIRPEERRGDSHLRDRFEDIFAEMLVHKLVFGNDHKTYMRNYVASYSIGSVLDNNDREEAFFHIFELLMRGFLVTDPFRREHLYKEGEAPETMPDLEEGFELFYKVIKDISSFFIDYDDILKGAPEFKLRYYFKKVFPESYHPVRCIFEDVTAIYDDICKDKLDPSPRDVKELHSQVKSALENGCPLVRLQYKDPKKGRDAEETGRLDALFLIRCLMQQHIYNLFGDANVNTENYTACLIRDIDGLPDPDAASEGKWWNKQCLDRPFNGLVAADRDTRSQYMLERIVLLKSLWDISTNLRARRMSAIIKRIWPEFS